MRPALKVNSELTPRAVTLKQLTGAAVLYLGKVHRATKQEKEGIQGMLLKKEKAELHSDSHTLPMIYKMWCRIHLYIL